MCVCVCVCVCVCAVTLLIVSAVRTSTRATQVEYLPFYMHHADSIAVYFLLCVMIEHVPPLTDACDCPNDFSTTLVVSPSVRAFCRAPSYVSAVCQCPLTDPLCVPQVREFRALIVRLLWTVH